MYFKHDLVKQNKNSNNPNTSIAIDINKSPFNRSDELATAGERPPIRLSYLHSCGRPPIAFLHLFGDLLVMHEGQISRLLSENMRETFRAALFFIRKFWVCLYLVCLLSRGIMGLSRDAWGCPCDT